MSEVPTPLQSAYLKSWPHSDKINRDRRRPIREVTTAERQNLRALCTHRKDSKFMPHRTQSKGTSSEPRGGLHQHETCEEQGGWVSVSVMAVRRLRHPVTEHRTCKETQLFLSMSFNIVATFRTYWPSV